MYDTLIRLMYRVMAPGHPRAHVQFHAVRELSTDTLWIHTHGMTQWGLQEVELVGVPYALRGYAHGLLFAIIGYMKNTKPILPDETIGGFFVSEDQPTYHLATARAVARPADATHLSSLRFVDLGAAADSGFAPRLFASHITALASQVRSVVRAERLYRIAANLLPVGTDADVDDLRENVNNWAAWEGLGSALFDLGRPDEGLECLGNAFTCSPKAMRALAEHFRGKIERGELIVAPSDPRARFWSELAA